MYLRCDVQTNINPLIKHFGKNKTLLICFTSHETRLWNTPRCNARNNQKGYNTHTNIHEIIQGEKQNEIGMCSRGMPVSHLSGGDLFMTFIRYQCLNLAPSQLTDVSLLAFLLMFFLFAAAAALQHSDLLVSMHNPCLCIMEFCLNTTYTLYHKCYCKWQSRDNVHYLKI